MDGVERLAQMNEVEQMREIMDLISNSMRKQNDKDRMEMLAILASTTAMETNLMSVQFAQRASTQVTGTKTKKNKGKALMKGVEQAENGKGKAAKTPQPPQIPYNSPQQHQQPQADKQQPAAQQQQAPASTLASKRQQGIEKKKRLASRGTMGTIKPFSTI